MHTFTIRDRYSCQRGQFYVFLSHALSNQKPKICPLGRAKVESNLPRRNGAASYWTRLGYPLAQYRQTLKEVPHLRSIPSNDST